MERSEFGANMAAEQEANKMEKKNVLEPEERVKALLDLTDRVVKMDASTIPVATKWDFIFELGGRIRDLGFEVDHYHPWGDNQEQLTAYVETLKRLADSHRPLIDAAAQEANLSEQADEQVEKKEDKEHIPSREEVKEIFVLLAKGRTFKETRYREDADGPTAFEVEVEEETPGKTIEYQYVRKGRHGGGGADGSIKTTIEATSFDGGMPYFGETVMNMKDGKWVTYSSAATLSFEDGKWVTKKSST